MAETALDLATGALPPGQRRTARFPITGEAEPPPGAEDRAGWPVLVDGAVDRPRTLTVVELGTARDLVMDVHCVTGWSRFGTRFGGVPLASVLDLVEPRPEAISVHFHADSPRGHDTSLPLDVARADTWIVWELDGRPLPPSHGGPVRTVTTSRYFYKSLKWLRRIELRTEHRLGYWERESHYHDNADPWPGDQRFTSGSLRPEQVARFLSSRDYAKWRGRLVLGVDLRAWSPPETARDLRELQLKHCDLRGVDLTGADLRGANLSLSDLRGASLAGADLRGADVEGADFGAADLRRADLRGAALSAANFLEARVEGLAWRGAAGLLEEQESYLRRAAGSGAHPGTGSSGAGW